MYRVSSILHYNSFDVHYIVLEFICCRIYISELIQEIQTDVWQIYMVVCLLLENFSPSRELTGACGCPCDLLYESRLTCGIST